VKEGKDSKVETGKHWYRIPNGTKVRHRLDGDEGVIDGLTEIVSGAHLNADGRTQYRMQVAAKSQVKLVPEDDLLFLADAEGLVMILKEKIDYRRYVTERLRSVFSDDRFVV